MDMARRQQKEIDGALAERVQHVRRVRREVGDRIAPGQDPVRFFDMNLKRVGDTDWPAAGAISPK
jgi:hypothetical protein